MNGETLLVTGGCGFIGSNFVHYALSRGYKVVNLDLLTYAGNPNNVKDIENDKNYSFVYGNICDRDLVSHVMKTIDTVVHFAAESHVERSITNPALFTKTNVVGTHILLECAREQNKRFFLMSTDEVYGPISEGTNYENSPMTPSSPYSASKSAADLLVHSYFVTYGMKTLTARGSNNFGAYQHTEKIIPHFITNLLTDKPLTLHGNGSNVRDWIDVRDTCMGIEYILENGVYGEAYNVGGEHELSNTDIAKIILQKMGFDESKIIYVRDRPGNDSRYSINNDKLHNLGWKQKFQFDDSMNDTINWYISHKDWWESLGDIDHKIIRDDVNIGLFDTK